MVHSSQGTEPLPVGLVGAGPWAAGVHAPMLAAGPQTRLAAVWARRPEAARALAAEHRTVAAATFEELLERSAAVAFAVPPDVQARLATVAAGAGKALLLEKPLALDLPAAQGLADAVAENNVVSQVVLTNRYHPVTRQFLADAAQFAALGARSCFLHGALRTGPFATPWRLVHGVLLDLGPHLLDLLDAALGPIEEVRSVGDPRRWVELTCRHAGGTVSQSSLSGVVGLDRARTTVELFGEAGALIFDADRIDHDECWPIVRAEFAAAVRSGRSHPIDVRRGLRIQRLLTQAGNWGTGNAG